MEQEVSDNSYQIKTPEQEFSEIFFNDSLLLNIFKFLSLKDLFTVRLIHGFWNDIITSRAFYVDYMRGLRERYSFLTNKLENMEMSLSSLSHNDNGTHYLWVIAHVTPLVEMYEWSFNTMNECAVEIKNLCEGGSLSDFSLTEFDNFLAEMLEETKERFLHYLHILIEIYNLPYMFQPEVAEEGTYIGALLAGADSSTNPSKNHTFYWFNISLWLCKSSKYCTITEISWFIRMHWASLNWKVQGLTSYIDAAFIRAHPQLCHVILRQYSSKAFAYYSLICQVTENSQIQKLK